MIMTETSGFFLPNILLLSNKSILQSVSKISITLLVIWCKKWNSTESIDFVNLSSIYFISTSQRYSCIIIENHHCYYYTCLCTLKRTYIYIYQIIISIEYRFITQYILFYYYSIIHTSVWEIGVYFIKPLIEILNFSCKLMFNHINQDYNTVCTTSGDLSFNCMGEHHKPDSLNVWM